VGAQPRHWYKGLVILKSVFWIPKIFRPTCPFRNQQVAFSVQGCVCFPYVSFPKWAGGVQRTGLRLFPIRVLSEMSRWRSAYRAASVSHPGPFRNEQVAFSVQGFVCFPFVSFPKLAGGVQRTGLRLFPIRVLSEMSRWRSAYRAASVSYTCPFRNEQVAFSVQGCVCFPYVSFPKWAGGVQRTGLRLFPIRVLSEMSRWRSAYRAASVSHTCPLTVELRSIAERLFEHK
jgi:hypothetical protein